MIEVGQYVQHKALGVIGKVIKLHAPGEYKDRNGNVITTEVAELDNGNGFILYDYPNYPNKDKRIPNLETLALNEARFYLQARELLNHALLGLGKLAVAMQLPQDRGMSLIHSVFTHTTNLARPKGNPG